MALFERIRQRFRTIGRSDSDEEQSADSASDDRRGEESQRGPGPVRAISEGIANGLRRDRSGRTPGLFDSPEQRQRSRIAEPADWSGRTSAPEGTVGLSGASILGDPSPADGGGRGSALFDPPTEKQSGGLFGSTDGAQTESDRGLTGSNLFGSGNDDNSGRLF